MQIFLQAEAEMAQALHIIAGFLHAAQHICGKHIIIVRSLRFLQQLLKLSWIDVADIDDERIAQRLGRDHELFDDAFGFAALAQDDILRHALFIHDDL